MDPIKIDKIYVIAINHSQEKYTDIQQRLDRLGLPNRVPFDIIAGHDGTNDPMPVDIKLYEDWKQPESWNKFWQFDMSPGEIGCAISHIRVWEMISRGEEERALILEEDFVPVLPVSKITEPEVDFDWAFLGRNTFNPEENTEIDDMWCKPGTSYNAHAYLLTKKGAQKLLEFSIKDNLIPIDEFMTPTYMNHRRSDINELFPNKTMNVLSTNQQFIVQASSPQTSTVSAHYYKDEVVEGLDFDVLKADDWDAWIAKYIDPNVLGASHELIVDDLGDNVYTFPLFTQAFCKEVVALTEQLNRWTTHRHRNYPTNDVLLSSVGLDDIYKRVLREIVFPMCFNIWNLEGKSWLNMKSENFIARYSEEVQSHLNIHHDFSHITMVVKLNDEYNGGGTWFPRYNLLAQPKRVGTAIVHPGQVTHRHGARPVYNGTRYVAVSFMRASHISTQ